jgi:multidrug efflux system membrane fusion protein
VSVRQIKTGPVDGQRTAILSGLKAGERVVIDGVDRLRDGAKVSVRNGPAPAAPGGKAPAANPAEPDQQQGQHRHRRQQGQGQSDQ